MKVKTVEVDGKQYAQLDEQGRVLYDNNGVEFAFDAAQTYGKITDLTKEAEKNRKARDEMQSKIAALDGIDPDKYQQAIKALEKIDQKQLLDAGEVDRIRQEIEKAYQPKLEAAESRAAQLETRYNSEKLAAAFSGSKFITDNLAVPPDMAKATFGDRFKIEDGQMRAYDASGNLIYSRSNPGSPAEFDEAISQIVDSYQYKDRILKASNHQGPGGDQGGGGGKRIITRAQFDAMNPVDKGKTATAIGQGTVKLAD